MTIRNLTLLAILVIVSCSLFANNEHDHPIDPAEKTFVDRNQDPWNPQVQQALRSSKEWKSFEQAHGDWYVAFNEQSGLPHHATGPVISIAAAKDLEQAARNFFSTHLSMYDIPVDQLKFRGVVESKDDRIVKFNQEVDGMPVLMSNAWVRFTNEGAVMAYGLDVFPNVQVDVTSIGAVDAARERAKIGIPYSIEGVEIAENLSILALPQGENGLAHRPVYVGYVNAIQFDGVPARYYTLVDAQTAEVYYRMNTIHNCAPSSGSVTVEGGVRDNALTPANTKNLPYLRVRVNGVDYYTDSLGQLSLPNLTSPTVATFYLQGRYAQVFNASNNDNTPSFTDTLKPGMNTISFTGKALESEIAGYYHTNTFHTHLKEYTPSSFTAMDTVMNVFVEINVSSCNAFYDGDINFYAAGNGCPSIALINDVVYHEYGHGVNYSLYDHFNGNFNNGALGEGYSDVWAFTLTENPVLGPGFHGGPTTFVRRYDVDRKVYPQDLVGETHADGEIIAGAWWDTYLNLGLDVEHLMDLFIGSQMNTPMAFSGNEGLLYRDILLETLLYDDNDNDIFNGTPNDTAIIKAFALHGITLLADAEVTHQDEPGLVASNATIDIDANVTITLPQYLGDVFLNYRTSAFGNYTVQQMVKQSGPQYSAQIPAQPEGTIVEYFFEITDLFGNAANVTPVRANDALPNLPYYQLVGFDAKMEEDFDNQWGAWLVNPDGTDDASTGMWDFLSPIASYDDNSVQVQTGTDHTVKGTPTNLCAVTGNANQSSPIGTNDVDDGATTLQSPVFDLTGYVKPAITYWRWFINDPPTGANPANDYLNIYISNDGTDWVTVERTNVSDASWRKKAFLVEDYVTPNSTVTLRFIASDSLIPGQNLDGGSIVEVAIDDLFVLDVESSTVGIDQSAGPQFGIFPNPAQDNIVVRWSAELDGSIAVRLLDVTGKIILEQLSNDTQRTLTINLHDLADGVYLVQLQDTEGGVSTQKIIKSSR